MLRIENPHTTKTFFERHGFFQELLSKVYTNFKGIIPEIVNIGAGALHTYVRLSLITFQNGKLINYVLDIYKKIKTIKRTPVFYNSDLGCSKL